MLYFRTIFIIILIIFILISLYSCNYAAGRYAELIREYASKYDVKPSVVFAIADVESHFNPRAKSSAGAIGIMQIMPATGKWIANNLLLDDYQEDDLFKADTNIRFGTWYISYLFSVFEEEWQVFAAYNAGEGAVKEWIKEKTFQKEDIPYPETANYVKKVERAQARYANKKIAAFN